MAIRLLQSAVVANYEVTAANKFHAGDGLMLDTVNLNNTVTLSATASTAALFAGFALGDHNTTSNTLIQNDPVGSTILSPDGSTFTSYALGFYVGAARRIGDWQDEDVAVVANLTDTSPLPRRGVGCLRQNGSQFITDRYTVGTAITTATALYVVASATLDTGGKLTDTSASNGVILARCDQFDSVAGLVYATIVSA
jgi:hypothetical protein